MAVVFNCAMRWGLIDLGANPVSLVRVKGVSRRQKEPRILNCAEIQALIAKLQDPCRTAVIAALGTGLRCSELFAFKWEDVNWDELTLSVCRAIVDGVVGDVKTKYCALGTASRPGARRGAVHLETSVSVQRRR
jgi:integrase